MYFTTKTPYTIVHFLLKELKISLKSSLYTISMSHNKSKSRSRSPGFYGRSQSQSPTKKDSRSLKFVLSQKLCYSAELMKRYHSAFVAVYAVEIAATTQMYLLTYLLTYLRSCLLTCRGG